MIIAAGRVGLRDARKELIQLAGDPLYPVIVRATALLLLNGYPPGRDIDQTIEIALMDEESLIRQTAVNHMRLHGSKRQSALLASMLYDPVKAVRMEAARRLSESSWEQLDRDQKRVFSAALNEFQQAMEYSADFASGRYNLGNLYVALNRPAEAIQNYRDAIKIDDMFYAAKVNLAMLYNQLGEQGKAEVLLRAVVKAHPQLHEVQYSLGLLLAEQKQYGEAARYLSSAARGIPNRARVHYNLGLLLEYLRRDPEAEAALLRALEIEPDNMDYLYAVGQYYLKREEYQKAKAIAEQMISKHPSNQIGHELLAVVNRRLQDHGS